MFFKFTFNWTRAFFDVGLSSLNTARYMQENNSASLYVPRTDATHNCDVVLDHGIYFFFGCKINESRGNDDHAIKTVG